MCYVYYHRKTRPTTTARRGIAGAAAWSPLWPTGKAANPRDRLRDLNQEAVMGRSGAPWFLGRSRTQPHVCVRCDIYICIYTRYEVCIYLHILPGMWPVLVPSVLQTIFLPAGLPLGDSGIYLAVWRRVADSVCLLIAALYEALQTTATTPLTFIPTLDRIVER